MADGHSTGERGALRKEPGGRLGVALVYPNAYRLGMANLGLHAVYRLLNDDPAALCERVFLPEDGGPPRTVESGRPLDAFDVVAFSLSFEDDYANVLAILDRAGLPLRSAERDARHPLVVAGGIAVQINPEPVAPFFDAFLVGEGEVLVPSLLAIAREALAARPPRPELLAALARLPGAYVPSLYDVAYSDTRDPQGAWVTRFEPAPGAPALVRRAYLPDLRGVATSRVVDSPDAQFGDLFLTEVARGCL
ncbi:MAG TPA: radical SAM protein, partial [Anaeromyxobacter sp.]